MPSPTRAIAAASANGPSMRAEGVGRQAREGVDEGAQPADVHGERRRLASVGDQVDAGRREDVAEAGQGADGDGVVAQVGDAAGGDDEHPRALVDGGGRGRRGHRPQVGPGRHRRGGGPEHAGGRVGGDGGDAVHGLGSVPTAGGVGDPGDPSGPEPLVGGGAVERPGQHPVAPEQRGDEGQQVAGLGEAADHGPVVDVLGQGVGRPPAHRAHDPDVDHRHGVDVVRLEQGRGRRLVGDRARSRPRRRPARRCRRSTPRRWTGPPGTPRPRRRAGRCCRRRG